MTPEKLLEHVEFFGSAKASYAVAHAANDPEAAANFATEALNALLTVKAEVEKKNAELRDKSNDLLDVRGILAPAGEPRKVPMDLVPAVAPAVQWLVDELTATRNNRLISAIFGHHKGAPKPFALYRTGEVRESGLVALGAEFPDGAVALRLANGGGWTTKSEGGAEGIAPSYATIVWLSDELESLAEMEQDRDRLAQLVARYAPIALPVLADIEERKRRAARMAAHTHYCWTCSDGTVPGDGCHNCRNTGMDQTPCVGCPGPQAAAEPNGTEAGQ